MKDHKKPFKYYLFIFLLSTVIVVAYSLYMILTDRAEIGELTSLFFVPIVFTGIYWAGDVLLEKLAKRRKKTDYEGDFLREVSRKMRDSRVFILEDYRKLQQDQRFQAALKIAYQIAKNGENETWNLDKLEKKFRPQTLEARAMDFVVAHVREIRESTDK